MVPWNNSGINISAHEDFTQKHGEKLNYFIGMKCPCTGSVMATGSNLPDANRPNLNCQACNGLGWFWEYKGQVIGVIENINQHKDLLMAGIATPGDLVLSPSLSVTLSDYDMIQLTWPEGIPFEGQLITRDATGPTDTAFYGIMSVTECLSVDPVTGNKTKYAPGVDFTFNGKVITWQGTNQPAANSVYSIKYQALADWITYLPPQPRRERGTNLGQRVILKKKHVVFGRA